MKKQRQLDNINFIFISIIVIVLISIFTLSFIDPNSTKSEIVIASCTVGLFVLSTYGILFQLASFLHKKNSINKIELEIHKMKIDDAIKSEYIIFCNRWNEYKLNEQDENLRVLAEDSERMIKTLYKIKYKKTEIDDIPHWLAFWSMLGKGGIL
ncbi:hypothetical protein ACFGXE_10555 [Pasteurella multocida]|uniref:hypothetical protein n=2 Tax=Pasteurella multocida TaxID=747 RepID=UPI002ED44311|nr:hypothetical protein V0I11_11070 [Pasteurella multocida]